MLPRGRRFACGRPSRKLQRPPSLTPGLRDLHACRARDARARGGRERHERGGERSFFEHIKAQSTRATLRWYTDSEAQIAYPKKHCFHLSQVPAWINAYERINVIDQLMRMDIEKVVRISKDGIVYEPHAFELLGYMRHKELPSFFNGPTQCYCTNVWRTGDEPFTRLDEQLFARRPSHPVQANLGIGGGGKTHRNLTDKGLQRVIYIAPSWKLARKKHKEYGCLVTVWARALSEDPAMWSFVDACANVIVWDEVSMMWMQTANFAIRRFPKHKHIFCGDPGFQLPPVRKMGDPLHWTPFNADEFVGHVEYFNESRRCKCRELGALLHTLRGMMQKGSSMEEISEWVLRRFSLLGRVFTQEQAIGMYRIEDMILVSRVSEPHNYCKEYTDALQAKQPVKVKASLQIATRERLVGTGRKRGRHEELVKLDVFAGVKLKLDVCKIQKYCVKSRDRIHSNGDIVMSDEPPKNVKSEVQHAFTIHSIQGETAEDQLFIDARRMFEVQHWYTALSRAQYLEQIFIVDAPQPRPTGLHVQTKIYRIVSDESSACYIGHTTQSLDERFGAHCSEFKNPNKRKRCSSGEVLKCKRARIELIEEWPCASLQEAKAREAHWIERTVGCVNVCLPTQSRAAYKERQALVTPTPRDHVETRREIIDSGRLNRTPEFLKEHEHLLQDEEMCRVRDVHDYLKGLKCALIDEEARGRSA